MKKIISVILTATMILAGTTGAFALDAMETTDDKGSVIFDGAKLTTETTGESFGLSVEGLEPGDSTVSQIKLENKSGSATAWYIASEVIDSLESTAQASGGAYAFKLEFDGTTLYDSTVGGETSQEANGVSNAAEGDEKGLKETELKDFVYLGGIDAGKSSTLKMTVKYDGNTIPNGYMGGSTEMKLGFAVEQSETHTITKTVTTGDTNLVWLYETIAVVALTAIGAVIITAKYDRKESN